MSGMTAVLPKNILKNSILGAVVALGCYVALQLIAALLIHSEILSENAIYPLVCLSAALSSFAGCGFSVIRGGKGSALSASAVVLVYLSLTLVVALAAGESDAIAKGLTGIGAGMAAGGLAAALAGSCVAKQSKNRREKGKRRYVRK